ncbi:hypothetical protein Pth03_09490 [Planotetraspora thailandica]|uniref:PepSY domain-containing protein n=1 Tax=Planotetraspora thailandica TaxID=487172 RepID=A0A8J3V9K7_9ACTN|nr:PepSY domain-containing protein [Planotetraspora thailandica]GII52560.1 hypothetical protein Pth03_09490 [Planotetraspora thailandica]
MTRTRRFTDTAKVTIAAAGTAALVGVAVPAAFASSSLAPTAGGSPADPGKGPASLPKEGAAQITYREAVAIARKRVPGARVTEAELEREDGRLQWEVELVKGPYEHEVEISPSTGEILTYERERRD